MNSKEFIIVLISIFSICCKAYSQENHQNLAPYLINSVSLELGGFGVVWSINYERKYFLKKDFGLAAQIGYGNLKYNFENLPIKFDQRIPIHLNFFYVKNSQLVDFGFAFVPYNLNNHTKIDKIEYGMGFEIGYKKHFKKMPIYFGGLIDLVIYDTNFIEISPWIGLEIGYVFSITKNK